MNEVRWRWQRVKMHTVENWNLHGLRYCCRNVCGKNKPSQNISATVVLACRGKGREKYHLAEPYCAMGLTNLVQHFSYNWQKRNSIAAWSVQRGKVNPRHWSNCHSKMFLQHCSKPRSCQNPSNEYCCLFWYYCLSGQILHTTEPPPLCLGLQWLIHFHTRCPTSINATRVMWLLWTITQRWRKPTNISYLKFEGSIVSAI